MPSPSHSLRITGARENNLKDISLELEHDLFTAVTGLSGSGKSSLAFSTVYAEGQRRYIETFSPYTRQFFDKVKKPDVLSLEHVRPALAIQQRTRVTSSRSTVGSMTNLFDLLKILWANLSVPHSPFSGEVLIRWTPEMVFEHLQQSAKKHQADIVLIGARLPFSKSPKLAQQEIDRLEILGYSRYFDEANGKTVRFEDQRPDSSALRSLLVVLDRVRMTQVNERGALESIEHAFALSRDNCTLVFSPSEMNATVQTYPCGYTSPNPNDPPLDIEVPLPRPALFDPNSPLGACTTCKGFGKTLTIDINKVVPLPNLSLEEGVLHPWNRPKTKSHKRSLLRFCEEQGISIDIPWHALSAEDQNTILHTRSRVYRGI
ncbi:MAG: hypothetical protein KDD55_00860, partial [Bdellovibrionales bacterium]|nr:hypothetical protein [Bdellovibrionales bacterium]